MLAVRLLLGASALDGLLSGHDVWPLTGSALLALLSFRTGWFFLSRLRVAFLVPIKREELGSAFGEWLHNYLQGYSVRKGTIAARRGVLLLLVGTVFAHAALLQLGEEPGSLLFLAAAAGAAAGLFLLSVIYRMELYTSWTVEGIRVQRQFFSVWFRFAALAVLLLVTLLALLPARYEVLDRTALWKGIGSLFTELRKTGAAPPPGSTANDEELRRIERQKLERLQEKKKGRPFLQELLRFSLYGLLGCLGLALLGAWPAHHYRFTTTPLFWRLPVLLWEILAKFLQILGYALRYFFLAGYRKRDSRLRDHARKTLEALFPAAEELTDEKKREIREIVEIYLTFIEEAGLRGFAYSRGETPAEYGKKLADTLPAITEGATGLTGAFYACRYSRDPAGAAVLATARTRLGECLQVLARIERVLPP